METKRITNIPGLMHLWQVDNLFLAGQPTMESWEKIKELGVKRIINIRTETEMDFSQEKNAVESLGMSYIQIPVVVNGQLVPEKCKELSELIDETDLHFIHCGSANRVAGWLITYLTQYRNMDFDTAVDIASENGLSNPGFINQAGDICGP